MREVHHHRQEEHLEAQQHDDEGQEHGGLALRSPDERGDEDADQREDHPVEHGVLHHEVSRHRHRGGIGDALEGGRAQERGRSERAAARGVVDEEPHGDEGGSDETTDDSFSDVTGVGGHGASSFADRSCSRSCPQGYHQPPAGATPLSGGAQCLEDLRAGDLGAPPVDTVGARQRVEVGGRRDGEAVDEPLGKEEAGVEAERGGALGSPRAERLDAAAHRPRHVGPRFGRAHGQPVLRHREAAGDGGEDRGAEAALELRRAARDLEQSRDVGGPARGQEHEGVVAQDDEGRPVELLSFFRTDYISAINRAITNGFDEFSPSAAQISSGENGGSS